MKKVDVKITSADPKDNSAVAVHIESRRGDMWNRQESHDAVTNKDATSFQLRPGQRLVVEASPEVKPVYDREQGAAINPATQSNDSGKADAPKTGDQRPNAAQSQEQARLKKEAEAQGKTPETTSVSPTKPVTETSPKPNPNPAPLSTNASMQPAGKEGETPTR